METVKDWTRVKDMVAIMARGKSGSPERVQAGTEWTPSENLLEVDLAATAGDRRGGRWSQCKGEEKPARK